MIAFIITSSILTYLAGMGFAYYFIENHTDWSDEGTCAGVIFWMFALPPLLVWHYSDKVFRYCELKERKKNEREALPPIYIKKGAKVQTMDEYKKLKELCLTFEMELESDKEVEKLLRS
jgi:hypothetical protein